jgi:hypothetical protein
VIFLALAWAGYSVLKGRDKGPDLSSVFKESNNIFDDSGSVNKARVRVRSLNITKALQDMNIIVEGYALEKPLLKSRESSYGLFIFKVQGNKLQEIIQKLTAIGNIEEQKELVDTFLVTKSLATEEGVLAAKQRELAAMQAMGQVYSDLSGSKEDLINQIRELEHRVSILKQSDTTMLYVQMIPSVSGNSLGLIKKFAINFFAALIVLLVASVLAYYGTKLVMYLLAMLGVKGFTGANLGGGYGYGYGNYSNRYYSRYGYGHSSGKRKVKRIYKGKPGSSADKTEPGDQDKDTK